MKEKEIRSIVKRVEEILNNSKHEISLEIIIRINEDEYPTINYTSEEMLE